MKVLARNINRSKWNAKPGFPHQAIRADAVTGCLKTKDDRLSMWRCQDDLGDIDQVFLALATGPNKTGFDTMDVVFVPEEDVERAGIAHQATEGETVVPDLRARHIDIVDLDLEKLGTLARIVASQVPKSQRRTEAAIKKLVRTAIQSGRINSDQLNNELRLKLDGLSR